jgi:hypothetical protein
MQILLEQGGLVDLCHAQCMLTDTGETAPETFARDTTQKSRKCAARACPFTTPTLLPPDDVRARMPPGIELPAVRVDFMLANRAFVDLQPRAEIVRGGKADLMSDSYPVRAEWAPAQAGSEE